MPDLSTTRAGLLQQEIRDLQRAGYSVTSYSDEHDVWTLTVEAPAEKSGAEPVTLRVECPPSYPLTPPFVYAEPLEMQHHQNPFTGLLCLLARPTHAWQPTWHLAGLLDRQLADTITAGRAEHAGIDVEEDQGEPASHYYEYGPDAGVLVDTAAIGEVTTGEGTLYFSIATSPSPGSNTPRKVIVVERVSLPDGQTVTSPPELNAAFGAVPATSGTGRWIYLDEPPQTQAADDVWRLANPDNRHSTPATFNDGTKYELRAVAFPEEHGHDLTGTGWLFILRTTPPKGRNNKFVPPKEELVRTFRGGHDDLLYRTPETQGLADKKVVLVGAGAIGSSIALHLARAGLGDLHVIDKDILEPGNLARHAATLEYVNMSKSQAIAALATQANPYLRAQHSTFPIGEVPKPTASQPNVSEFLANEFASTDLVIDATADPSVQQYTYEVARTAQTTWMMADATPGIGGGTTVSIKAEDDACYACLQWRQCLPADDPEHLPSAPEVDDPGVQPVGCAERTFTGSGFDLEVVSTQAARVAVATLLADVDGGYPSDGFEVHLLTLRTPDGQPVPPSWQGFHLERYEHCGNH